MSLVERQPLLQDLPSVDKLSLVQWLVAQVVSEPPLHPITTVTDIKADPLWDIVGMADGEPLNIACHHDA